MQKYFNTAGPIIPKDHYHIDRLHRLDWEEVQHLIASKKYFVLHAPRQTGKTSTLLAMMETLNETGEYQALYVNIEAAQAARQDVEAGLSIVCETIASTAAIYSVQPELEAITHRLLQERHARSALTALLSHWAQLSEKPIVLMLDEVGTYCPMVAWISPHYYAPSSSFSVNILIFGYRVDPSKKPGHN